MFFIILYLIVVILCSQPFCPPILVAFYLFWNNMFWSIFLCLSPCIVSREFIFPWSPIGEGLHKFPHDPTWCCTLLHCNLQHCRVCCRSICELQRNLQYHHNWQYLNGLWPKFFVSWVWEMRGFFLQSAAALYPWFPHFGPSWMLESSYFCFVNYELLL